MAPRSFFYISRSAIRHSNTPILISSRSTYYLGSFVRTIRQTRRQYVKSRSLPYARYGNSRQNSTSFSPPSAPVVDQSRRSLYYHYLAAPNPYSDDIPAYAASFLEQPPKDSQGPAILGWLPAAVSSSEGEEAGIEDFVENPSFMDVLHQVIQRVLEDRSSELLNAEALQRSEGWMHISDQRNIPAVNRISDAQDIIASVMVENGQILPQTYCRMPSYRICTTDGLTTLSEDLESKLLDELARREHHS